MRALIQIPPSSSSTCIHACGCRYMDMHILPANAFLSDSCFCRGQKNRTYTKRTMKTQVWHLLLPAQMLNDLWPDSLTGKEFQSPSGAIIIYPYLNIKQVYSFKKRYCRSKWYHESQLMFLENITPNRLIIAIRPSGNSLDSGCKFSKEHHKFMISQYQW